jgi:hypothetical protein
MSVPAAWRCGLAVLALLSPADCKRQNAYIAPLPTVAGAQPLHQSVILAVPLALAGPAIALAALNLANNFHAQVGLVLLIALATKNVILIVGVARERRRIDRIPIIQATVEAARTGFRPIVMTSFAFLGRCCRWLSPPVQGLSTRIPGPERADRHARPPAWPCCLSVLFVMLQGIKERIRRTR